MIFVATYYLKNQAKFLRYSFSSFREFFDHLNKDRVVEVYKLEDYLKNFYPENDLENSQKLSYEKILEKEKFRQVYIISPSQVQGDIEICDDEDEIYRRLILDRNIFDLILDLDTIFITSP